MTEWRKGLDGIKALLAQGGRGLVDAVYPLECVWSAWAAARPGE